MAFFTVTAVKTSNLICNLHLQGSREAKQETTCLLPADFLLGLLFNPDDGGNILLQNVG
jgi:hypothetical protein